MNFLTSTVDYLLDGPAYPRMTPPVRNRVDVDPNLIIYHDTRAGAKPAPSTTNFLPVRTRLPNATIFTTMGKAQTEAYYEEIDSIPSASLGQASEFAAGHWYVVHPLTYLDVREFNTKVLKDLAEWIEVTWPNDLFVRKAKQVRGFKEVRAETLDEVKKELARREKRGEVGQESGYTGEWEVVGEEEEGEGKGEGEEGKVAQTGGREVDRASRVSEAALEAAAEAGRKAAAEAKFLDEWHVEQ
jgi:hypothetical protein